MFKSVGYNTPILGKYNLYTQEWDALHEFSGNHDAETMSLEYTDTHEARLAKAAVDKIIKNERIPVKTYQRGNYVMVEKKYAKA